MGDGFSRMKIRGQDDGEGEDHVYGRGLSNVWDGIYHMYGRGLSCVMRGLSCMMRWSIMYDKGVYHV